MFFSCFFSFLVLFYFSIGISSFKGFGAVHKKPQHRVKKQYHGYILNIAAQYTRQRYAALSLSLSLSLCKYRSFQYSNPWFTEKN